MPATNSPAGPPADPVSAWTRYRTRARLLAKSKQWHWIIVRLCFFFDANDFPSLQKTKPSVLDPARSFSHPRRSLSRSLALLLFFFPFGGWLVVLCEVSLASVHPELPGRCVHPPHSAVKAAEALHILTLTLLAILNADWVLRALLIGPLRFFGELTHWIDSGLVAAALALELLLVGEAAVTANLAVIVLRLARIGHAFVELAVEEGKIKADKARSAARREAAQRLLRLAAAAAVANARFDAAAADAASAARRRSQGGGGGRGGKGANGKGGDDGDDENDDFGTAFSRRNGVPVVKGLVGSKIGDGLS